MQQPECKDEQDAHVTEEVAVVDLGNAKIETKQWAPFPFVTDSTFQRGWG